MKRYFAVVSMMCLFALAGIAGAVAQEAQKANPATDFKYDLNQAGDGVIIQKYKGTATAVVIPTEIEDFPVVGVGFKAFSETDIVSVVFPDSDIWISASCFEECKSLQNVVLPKNLKTISESLFCGCTALKEIILPNNIEEIKDASFSNSGLKAIEIPDSVYSIGDWTSDTGPFAYCKNLKTITIGNGISTIGRQLCYGCTNLTTVTMGSGIRYINTEAFKDCSSLTTVNINVEKVGYSYRVFSGCSSLSLKEKQKIRKTGYTDEF